MIIFAAHETDRPRSMTTISPSFAKAVIRSQLVQLLGILENRELLSRFTDGTIRGPPNIVEFTLPIVSYAEHYPD
jgi:hypothetical protein